MIDAIKTGMQKQGTVGYAEGCIHIPVSSIVHGHMLLSRGWGGIR
jgi:hypothetical protein